MLTRIPWKLVGYVVGVVLAVAAFNTAMSFIPGTDQWRGKRAVAENVQLRGQVSTLEREAAGNAEIGQAVERHYERETIIREIAAQAETEARNAPDAETPLPVERADRLRLHDQRMCVAYPSICPDPDPAGSGAGAVPPAGPAR